jgi:hypothetical protein
VEYLWDYLMKLQLWRNSRPGIQSMMPRSESVRKKPNVKEGPEETLLISAEKEDLRIMRILKADSSKTFN